MCAIVRFQIGCGLVELCRAIESQLGSRLGRGLARVALGSIAVVTSQPMAGQHVGSFGGPLFDRLGQPHVHPPQSRLIKACHHGLANTVVVGFCDIGSLAPRPTDQALFHESRNAALPAFGSERYTRCTSKHLLWQRIAGHRDDLQHMLAFLGQAAHPFEDHPVESERATVNGHLHISFGQDTGAKVVHQFDREKRIAIRFSHSSLRNTVLDRGPHIVAVEKIGHERARVLRRQGTKGDDLEVGRFADVAEQGLGLVAIGGGTGTGNEKQGWRPRLLDQCAQEGQAIEIRPLKIVDEDDHGLHASQMSEKLAECDEGPVAQLIGIAQRRQGVALLVHEPELA